MEIIVNALVLRSVDYKDNDKILTLFSLERGIITAGIKGVKKAGAKLKFAAEPFCFAEYALAEKNGRFTVIGSSYSDGFYNLRLNIEKYYASAVIAEFAETFFAPETPDAEAFSLILNAVKDICYKENERLSLAIFLINALKISGYGIDGGECYACGEIIKGRVFYRFSDSSFSCENDRDENFSEIMPQTYNAFLKVLGGDGESVDTEDVTRLIKFLLYDLRYETETKLKSASAYLEFIS